MAKQEQIRKKVEETLASLDHMEQLEAGPTFYSRLKARIDAGKGKPAPSSLFFFPRAFRPVLLAILILINLITIVHVVKSGGSGEKVEPVSIKTVAADYSFNQNLDDLIFSGEVKEK
jgi:hypothetical protein